MPFTTINGSNVPIRIWAPLGEVDSRVIAQLKNVASLPWVAHHVAVMPDVHLGRGATVGTVIAMRGAVAPAAVGVDIGCGMTALCFSSCWRRASVPEPEFGGSRAPAQVLRDTAARSPGWRRSAAKLTVAEASPSGAPIARTAGVPATLREPVTRTTHPVPSRPANPIRKTVTISRKPSVDRSVYRSTSRTTHRPRRLRCDRQDIETVLAGWWSARYGRAE